MELYPLDHSDFVTFCRFNTALLFDTEAGGGGGGGAGAGAGGGAGAGAGGGAGGAIEEELKQQRWHDGHAANSFSST